MTRSVMFIVLLGTSLAASAQLYRWTDERGRVHVSDTPPPPGARKVERKDYGNAPGAAAAENMPYALRAPVQSNPVTLYTVPECNACAAARALLNARGVPFREISVVSESQAEELKKLVGGLSVPALKVGASVQKGFEEGAYHSLLDAAGYPRTGILPARSQAAPKPEPAAPSAESEAAEAQEPKGPYAPR